MYYIIRITLATISFLQVQKWEVWDLKGFGKKCSRMGLNALCLNCKEMFSNGLMVDSPLQIRFSLGLLWITTSIPNEKVNSCFKGGLCALSLYQWYLPSLRAGNSQLRVLQMKTPLLSAVWSHGVFLTGREGGYVGEVCRWRNWGTWRCAQDGLAGCDRPQYSFSNSLPVLHSALPRAHFWNPRDVPTHASECPGWDTHNPSMCQSHLWDVLTAILFLT